MKCVVIAARNKERLLHDAVKFARSRVFPADIYLLTDDSVDESNQIGHKLDLLNKDVTWCRTREHLSGYALPAGVWLVDVSKFQDDTFVIEQVDDFDPLTLKPREKEPEPPTTFLSPPAPRKRDGPLRVGLTSGYRFMTRTRYILEGMTGLPVEVEEIDPRMPVSELDPSRFDLLWTFYPFKSGRFCRRAKEMHGIPYIMSVRGGFWHLRDDSIDSALAVYMNADFIVTLSDQLYNETCRRFPQIRDIPKVKIPNGGFLHMFEGADIEPFDRSAWGIKKSTKIVAHITNFHFTEKRAGTDLIVKAWNDSPSVKKRNCCLVIAGKTGKFGYTDEEADSLGDKIVAVGELDDSASLLEASDVFIYDSLEEGQPSIVMEAMSSGTPVVLAKRPWSVELMAGTPAGLVYPDPASGIEMCMSLLSRYRDRKYLGEDGRSFVRYKYDWREIGRRYFDVFCVVAGRRPV